MCRCCPSGGRARRGRPPRVPRASPPRLPPWTRARVAISARFPRQASWPRAFWVAGGRRLSFAAMRSTTLSVKPLARMRGRSQRQAAVSGSKVSSASSASAVRNWIVKNGLPAVFSNTSSRQGLRALRLRMQRIGEQPRRHPRARAAPAGSPAPSLPASRILSSIPPERVRGADLVVPVGADQQQVAHLRMRDQMLEQIEGRRIQPLQIVEEQRQRMLRPRRTRRGIAGTPAGSDSGGPGAGDRLPAAGRR